MALKIETYGLPSDAFGLDIAGIDQNSNNLSTTKAYSRANLSFKMLSV